ncbi:MAG: type IV toxin-antitoxin system AbiEi family antitoxin domain-containing protein [Actinomycetes bacterium]
MTVHLPQTVHDIMAANGGGASMAVLRSHGLTRGQVARLVRDGALVRLGCGCYTLPVASGQ